MYNTLTISTHIQAYLKHYAKQFCGIADEVTYEIFDNGSHVLFTANVRDYCSSMEAWLPSQIKWLMTSEQVLTWQQNLDKLETDYKVKVLD